jgi:hypothetical protein
MTGNTLLISASSCSVIFINMKLFVNVHIISFIHYLYHFHRFLPTSILALAVQYTSGISGLVFLMFTSFMCSAWRRVKLRPVCPTFSLLHPLHFNLYTPLWLNLSSALPFERRLVFYGVIYVISHA